MSRFGMSMAIMAGAALMGGMAAPNVREPDTDPVTPRRQPKRKSAGNKAGSKYKNRKKNGKRLFRP